MEGTALTYKCKEIWESCLQHIKTSISPVDFQTWFEPIVPVKLENKVLTIQVPTYFFYEFIEEQYISLVGQALRYTIGAGAKLEYSVAMEKKSNGARQAYGVSYPTSASGNRSYSASGPRYAQTETVAVHNPFVMHGMKKIQVDPQLNSEYTFKNFVEGDCNRLARSASEAVASNPGKTAFNPLFIYGSSGLGKTHLCQAIGNEVKNQHPDKVILYVSANKFFIQYTDAVIKRNALNDFLHFYQMIDVLIIDDIQELAGKESTQNTFFHIFNHLHQSGKQLVLTSDKPPVELKGMKERLLTRFKWGLPADLQSPGYETRVDILKSKVKKDGIIISDDIVHYIASQVTDNVRELEGALISLLALSTLNKEAITVDVAKSVVDRLVHNVQREMTVDHILKKVCDYFQLQGELLQTKSRKREIVQARQVAMYFSKLLTNASSSSIGAQIGRRDHATVHHACKTVKNMMETNVSFKKQMREVESLIRR